MAVACALLMIAVSVPNVQATAPIGPNNVGATQGNLPPSTNINDSGFHLTVCDGPSLPGGNPTDYVPCDFNGAMLQVQHLINIAIVGGVLVAIFGFSYAGFLYIRGREADRTQASSMFQKIGIGFIIMLSAWFIVYQILAWLTGGSGFGTLLGPKS